MSSYHTQLVSEVNIVDQFNVLRGRLKPKLLTRESNEIYLLQFLCMSLSPLITNR
jgi:hypothetical protein